MTHDMHVEQDRGLQGGRRLCFMTLPSTQAYALAQMATLQHGDVIWARSQPQGRGRFDRVWHATPGQSLAFSVLLKQPPRITRTPLTLQLAALAVCSALREHHVDAGLKWPNDVVTHRGKIAGILADGIPEAEAMILGIGINVNMTREDFADLPASPPATSVRIETRTPTSVRSLLDTVLTALDQALTRLAEDGATWLPAHWSRYDRLTGKTITVHTAHGTQLHGLYRGMTPDGALQLEDPAGQCHTFWSGDVSLSPPQNP